MFFDGSLLTIIQHATLLITYKSLFCLLLKNAVALVTVFLCKSKTQNVRNIDAFCSVRASQATF